MNVDRIFDEKARARVKEAVRRAEQFSRGQIVPVVVEKSARYPETSARGAVAMTALVTALWLLLRSEYGPTELVLYQVAAGILGAFLGAFGPGERLLAGRHSMDEAVRARAMRAFHEHGLKHTKEGTGVLVFASLFERHVVVLGDYGIHAKMGEAEWNRAIDALVKALKSGDPAQGFEDAIGLCGARLKEHFPRDGSEAPQANELEDELHASKS